MAQASIRVVITAGPGVDDAPAVLFALASTELDMAGITTVFGNADVAATKTGNAVAVLDAAGRPGIPVAAGAAAHLAGASLSLGHFR